MGGGNTPIPMATTSPAKTTARRAPGATFISGLLSVPSASHGAGFQVTAATQGANHRLHFRWCIAQFPGAARRGKMEKIAAPSLQDMAGSNAFLVPPLRFLS